MATELSGRELFVLIAALFGSAGPVASSAADTGLLSSIGTLDNLRRLGHSCRSLLPADTNKLQELAGFDAGRAVNVQLAAFITKREADFRSGKILLIEGWVFAEAECALAALCAQP